MLPLYLILLRAKKQLQMKKVSVTSCCEKNKAPLPHLMDLAKSAGVYRRPFSLASPKIVEEGGRSSKHGWQQHIACDKRFVCLQDQNKHVHAQTTTTSQSAKVQDTGTQYTTTEEGIKPLRFQNTMWVKTKLSSSANVKRINRRRPSLHAHNLFSSAKKWGCVDVSESKNKMERYPETSLRNPNASFSVQAVTIFTQSWDYDCRWARCRPAARAVKSIKKNNNRDPCSSQLAIRNSPPFVKPGLDK